MKADDRIATGEEIHPADGSVRRIAGARLRRGRARLLLGTCLLVYAAAASPAHAQNECGLPPAGGGTVTCGAGEYPDGITYDPVVADLTVVLEPGVTARDNVELGSSAPGIDLILSGPTDTLVETGASSSSGVRVVSSYGAVEVAVDEVATTGATSSDGIQAFGLDVRIDAESISTSGASSDGIDAFATYDVTVISDAIATTGDSSTGIEADADAEATLAARVEVTSGSVNTQGQFSPGIAASGDLIRIESGTVSTHGGNSRGIVAESFAPNGGHTDAIGVDITSGSVTTSGANSIGISASAEYAIEVISTDSVATHGKRSAGIRAVSDNAEVTVTSTTVTTSGNYSRGISAVSPLNDITITSDMVSTSGDFSPGITAYIEGLYVSVERYLFGEGDIVIDSGTIATDGEHSAGIIAHGADNVTITSTSIATHGIGIIASGILSSTVTVTSDTLTTVGEGSAGIHVTNLTGETVVTSGHIVTSGDRATGIAVGTGFDSYYISGDATVISGTVRVSGAYSGGIVVRAGTVAVTSDSVTTRDGSGIVARSFDRHHATAPEIGTRVTSGSVSTGGDRSFGIVATAGQLGIVVTSTGTVSTAGDNAIGIYARSGTTLNVPAGITIASADVRTQGAASFGIYARTNDNDIEITSGNVSTAGNGSPGIHARANGDVRVTSGDVATGGADGIAIDLSSIDGDAALVSTGTVRTAGDGSDAVVVTAAGTVSIESNIVITSGDNANGIDATQSANDSAAPAEIDTLALGPVGGVTITSGSVTTRGMDSDGIETAGEGAVTISSGSVSTQGHRSAGIYARSHFDGAIVITSGNVATTGNTDPGNEFGNFGNAHGIEARANSGSVTINSMTVSTGDADSGRHAFGILATSDSGAINVTSGTVRTRGDGAVGIAAQTNEPLPMLPSPAPPAPATLLGAGRIIFAAAPVADAPDISITAGTVTTGGHYATGILAISREGGVTVESGAISTSGDFAPGIRARSTGSEFPVLDGGPVVIDSGSIATAGERSTGLDVLAETIITVDSDNIVASGDVSHGMLLQTHFAGGISVTSGSIASTSRGIDIFQGQGGTIDIVSEQIETSGAFGDGIFSLQTGESIRTRVDSGTIVTAGMAARGIWARSSADVSVTSDSVQTSGGRFVNEGAYGIQVDAYFGSIDIVSGSVTTEGDSATGILARSQHGSIAINSEIVVTGGNGAIGISASAGDDVSVTSESVQTTGSMHGGDGAGGIDATSRAGAITIDSRTVTTAGRNSPGIHAIAGGQIFVTSDSVTTSGDISGGIFASSSDGDVAVDSGTVTTSGEIAAAAISARASSGDVDVDSDSVVTTGEGDLNHGVSATAYNGNVAVTSGTASTTGHSSVGIVAFVADGRGSVSVTSNSVTTTGDFSAGISASTPDGSVEVINSGAVVTWGERSAGIGAGVGRGDVEITSNAVSTSGDESDGIRGSAAAGSITITSTTVVTAGDDSRGISASASGDVLVTSGNVTSAADGILGVSSGGDTTIASTGTVRTSDVGSIGILAFGVGTVTIDSNIVVTTGDGGIGIDATRTANYAGAAGSVGANVLGPDGGVIIVSGSVTTSGGASTGIDAFAIEGDVEILSTGTVTTTGANSDGIVVDTVHGFALVDANSVSATGAGSDAIAAFSIVDIDIVVRGLVESTQGSAVQAHGTAAIVTVMPGGTVRGRVDLTDTGDTLANAGTFDAIGTSAFGGGTDVFTNSGTTRSVNGAALLGGLETFSSSGIVTMADGAVNDRLTVGDFVGLAGSRLILDVDFTANAADLLVTGAATGSTTLQIGASGSPLGFTGGILVVDGSAGTSPTAFTLGAGGTIDNGFVTSGLIFRASDFDFLLINTPNQPVFETSQIGEIVTNVWQQSADAVFAQIQSASDRPDAMARNGRGFGVWGQMWAGGEQREGSQAFTIGATTTVFDVGYRQDYEGVQGGLDHQSGNLLFGVTFGIGSSDAEFAATALDIDIVNLGAYAGFRAGAFYVNALVKYDWLDVTTNPGPGLSTAFEANEWGAQLDAGARFEFGRLFAEPYLGISWISADIDDHGAGGAAISFDEAESLRGYAGLRLGGAFDTGGAVWAPFVGGRIIEEFNGENENDFVLGSNIHFVDDAPGTHGELSAGLSVITGIVEVFVRGEMLIGGDDVDGESIRGGVRIRF